MSNEILEKLADVVIRGKIKEAKPLTEEALAAGIDAKTIIFDSLSKAMAVVGEKYENKQYFLPQVLLSAQTMYQSLDVALPKLVVDANAVPGKIVLAVVEGDVHDIGKNIVKAMLTGAGLTIFDLGRDVPVKNIVEKAKAEEAQVVAASTLMTPTLAAMKEIERMLAEENLKGKMKTIIGGGATSKEFAAQIGADGWAYDAVEAVQVVQNLLK
ncbi:MAG TPA: cobalamin-dependent protein [Methanomassiliicoccaceae archaeon]|nr:cobalamin-dependent protein [Methanomassiliicoccaceae archaeon]HOQ25766.1 cobalamin-dependent protein [Methanomassiliicoccaceae archaeon]HPT74435.1 cobalamin-dependent protein [Methanomassiliicoccaceae archaeon]HQD87630.1 cobalamin-dependent protein [Methanomassiliicoccaceae archaeon]